MRPAVNDLEHETENAEAESANARLVYMLLIRYSLGSVERVLYVHAATGLL